MSMLTKTSGAAWLAAPQNMGEVWKWCETIAASSFAPRDFKGKPGDVMAAVQFGAEVGLSPMQSLQGVAVVNGRPSLWGDALLGLVQAHPSVKKIVETFDDRTMTATCVVHRDRNGEIEITPATFSQEDAVKAGLWNKSGPWAQYPKRMLKMRARSFAIRDACSDITRGLVSREEAQDTPAVVATVADHARASEALPASVVTEPQLPPPTPSVVIRDAHRVYWFNGKHKNKPLTEIATDSLERYIERLDKMLTDEKWAAVVPGYLAAAREELCCRPVTDAEVAAMTADGVPFDAETGEVLTDDVSAKSAGDMASAAPASTADRRDGRVRNVGIVFAADYPVKKLAGKPADKATAAQLTAYVAWAEAEELPADDVEPFRTLLEQLMADEALGETAAQ